MNIPNKKIIITLFLILLTLIGINIINSLFFKPPELISTVPPNRTSAVELTTPIILNFSRPVSPSDVKLVSSGQEDFTLRGEGNSIVAEHDKAFFNNRDYTVEIYFQGDLIDALIFTTLRQESDPRVTQEIQETVENDYPLASLTPYRTDNFEVVYSAPLTLQIEIYANSLSANDAINIVKSWVNLQGLDPDSHTYTLKPSPVPTTYGVSN